MADSRRWITSLRTRRCSFSPGIEAQELSDFLDFAVADAGSAGAEALVGAVDDGADGLLVDVPAAIGHVVGVAHFVAELRTFAANFTNSCHDGETPDLLTRLRHANFDGTRWLPVGANRPSVRPRTGGISIPGTVVL